MKFLFNLILGALFGLGLQISGFCNPKKIGDAANLLNEFWEPSIPLTLASTATFSGCLFVLIRIFQIFQNIIFCTRTASKFDNKVLLGTILFGIGIGLSGLSPSTAILNLSLGKWETILFFIFMTGGLFLGRLLSKPN